MTTIQEHTDKIGCELRPDLVRRQYGRLAKAMVDLEFAIEQREYVRWNDDYDKQVANSYEEAAAKVEEAQKALIRAVQSIANQAVADAAMES